MPTQRIAFSCAFAAFLLFSCNNKNTRTGTANNIEPSRQYDTVQVLPDEPINIGVYNTRFIDNATQHFTVAAQKISVVTARNGLKLTINPSVLEKEDGSPVNGKINVSIIELTNNNDLFKSNAATVSNGRLLVSGGSYFLGMEYNGEKLQIKKGNSLQVEFPKLKANEMELFYGNRDTSGNMNWIKANQPLSFTVSMNSAAFTPPYPDSARKSYKRKCDLYDSLETKVIFLNKETTVREMVSMLQKRGIDKIIDSTTIELPFGGYRCFNGYKERRTYSFKQYRVISCKDLEKEKDSLAKLVKINEMQDAANSKYYEERQRDDEENSLTGQLQKYYSPCAVTQLGWINCDHFYNSPQDSDVEFELPITLNDPVIRYFLIYRSFNGLINGELEKGKNSKYLLSKLPEDEPVTLIAFTKSNGQLFQCREEFVTQKDKTVQLNFKNISPEELTRMFGKNVRI